MNPIIIEPAINGITRALNAREMVSLEKNLDGTISVKPVGFFSRIWHWNDAKFHEKRLSNLAEIVAKIIDMQDHVSIKKATENPSLKAARNLLKEIRPWNFQTNAILKLQKEVCAAKLGINVIDLDNNPGFQQFTEKNHLERYLHIFKHSLQIDHTGAILILQNGKYQPWKKISEDSRSWPLLTSSPSLAWIYGKDGIQFQDMYDWQELKPFMKSDPSEWYHQYVFELCACHNPISIKNGVHSWFRLKTPSGDIYSAGLYRPDKLTWTENLKFPLRIKPGYLMQPDVSEFWDFEITTVSFTISEKQFHKIKQTVETDKKNEDLIFQMFDSNCLIYNKKLAQIGGVDFPTTENILTFAACPNTIHTATKIINILPSFVQKICLYVSAFFINIGQLCFGGCMIDNGLNEQQRKKASPYLKSILDVFDVNKIYINHPNTLKHVIRKKVHEWRQQQIEALNQSESNLEIIDKKTKQIMLSLPPSYYRYG
jgi:hypothetical protein